MTAENKTNLELAQKALDSIGNVSTYTIVLGVLSIVLAALLIAQLVISRKGQKNAKATEQPSAIVIEPAQQSQKSSKKSKKKSKSKKTPKPENNFGKPSKNVTFELQLKDDKKDKKKEAPRSKEFASNVVVKVLPKYEVLSSQRTKSTGEPSSAMSTSFEPVHVLPSPAMTNVNVMQPRKSSEGGTSNKSPVCTTPPSEKPLSGPTGPSGTSGASATGTSGATGASGPKPAEAQDSNSGSLVTAPAPSETTATPKNN